MACYHSLLTQRATLLLVVLLLHLMAVVVVQFPISLLLVQQLVTIRRSRRTPAHCGRARIGLQRPVRAGTETQIGL